MKIGWISLHRKIQECDIWLDDEPFDRRSAWIDLILSANHEDKGMIFDGHQIVVQRGQLITSVRKLSAKWRWGKDKTLAYLRLLEELQMIERKSDSRKTLLSIVNYDIYQNGELNKQTVNRHSTDSEQTLSRHSADTDPPQTIMNNNENNKNKINNKGRFVKPSVEEIRAYCLERNNGINAQQFFDYYESKGWMIGKNHMKDWKASVRTWENRRKGEANGSVGTVSSDDEERRNRELDEYIKRQQAGEFDDEDEEIRRMFE